MKYTFQCPMCSAIMTADAMNDDEAVNKLMASGGDHMKQMHPNAPMDPDMTSKVRSGMKKQEM